MRDVAWILAGVGAVLVTIVLIARLLQLVVIGDPPPDLP